jgi:hypothetical protein
MCYVLYVFGNKLPLDKRISEEKKTSGTHTDVQISQHRHFTGYDIRKICKAGWLTVTLA